MDAFRDDRYIFKLGFTGNIIDLKIIVIFSQKTCKIRVIEWFEYIIFLSKNLNIRKIPL